MDRDCADLGSENSVGAGGLRVHISCSDLTNILSLFDQGQNLLKGYYLSFSAVLEES